MNTELKKNSSTEKCFTYFPYFNHKLYENPSDTQEEEYSTKSDSFSQNLEDSSTNTSNDSICSIEEELKLIPPHLLDLSPYKTTPTAQPKHKLSLPTKLFETELKSDKAKDNSSKTEILPDLQKYKLPKSLFCKSNIKLNEKEKKNLYQKREADSFIDIKLDLNSKPFVPKFEVYPVIICSSQAFFANNAGNKFGQIPLTCLNNYNTSKNYEKKKKKKKVEFVEREGDWSCYKCKNINFSFREKCNKCQFSKEESEKKFAEVGEALLKLADRSIYDKKC